MPSSPHVQGVRFATCFRSGTDATARIADRRLQLAHRRIVGFRPDFTRGQDRRADTLSRDAQTRNSRRAAHSVHRRALRAEPAAVVSPKWGSVASNLRWHRPLTAAERRDGGDGELVDEVVHRVAAVALDPAERRRRAAVTSSIERLPQVAVGDRLLWRSASRSPATSPTTGRGSSSRRRSSRSRPRPARPGSARTASSAAVISIRWFVVCASPPAARRRARPAPPPRPSRRARGSRSRRRRCTRRSGSGTAGDTVSPGPVTRTRR